jgi:hypothetical protein
MSPRASGFVMGVAVGIFAYHIYTKSSTGKP